MYRTILNSGIAALPDLYTCIGILIDIGAVDHPTSVIVHQNTHTSVLKDAARLYSRIPLFFDDNAGTRISENLTVLNYTFPLIRDEYATIITIMNVAFLNIGGCLYTV